MLMRGIGDQDIDPTELFDCSFDRVIASAGVGKIAWKLQAFRAGSFDRGPGFVGVRLLDGQIADRDVGAFASIEQGDSAADAGIAAGDQGDLAFELAGGAVAISAIAWTRIKGRLETRCALVLLRKRR